MNTVDSIIGMDQCDLTINCSMLLDKNCLVSYNLKTYSNQVSIQPSSTYRIPHNMVPQDINLEVTTFNSSITVTQVLNYTSK